MRLGITEADHTANQFWTLTADVRHEVPAQALFDALPEEACEVIDGKATHEERCYLLDLIDDRGDIVDNKEVTEAVVVRLLDEPIENARARSQKYWEAFG